MDLFVKDGNQIYKVNYICMCNECRKRGMPELELVDQEGNYVDYIKMSDLFNGKYELFQKINESEKFMNGLNQKEILELLKLLQRMNLKQLAKLKEIIVEVENGTKRLESLINDFNKLF